MNFIIIGESVNRLSDEFVSKRKEIPWMQIYGLRNLVAHNYFGVDAEEVWQIIQTDLRPLVNQIEKLLK